MNNLNFLLAFSFFSLYTFLKAGKQVSNANKFFLHNLVPVPDNRIKKEYNMNQKGV